MIDDPFEPVRRQLEQFQNMMRNISFPVEQVLRHEEMIKRSLLPLLQFYSVIELGPLVRLSETALKLQSIIDSNREHIAPALKLMLEQKLRIEEVMRSAITAEVIERWNPVIEKVTESEHFDAEIEQIEELVTEYPVVNQEIHIHIEPESNRFTWKDLITIAGILIALLAWFDSNSSQEGTIANNVKEKTEEAIEEVNETLENIFSFIGSHFPDWSDDHEDVQEDPVTP